MLLEYNGMWQLNSFYQNMPNDWAVYQEFCFVDAGTFAAYNSNMRSLMVDKFQSADLVVFNRFRKDLDEMECHKAVRTITKRAQIAYEYTDGNIVNDTYKDPLPFDKTAKIIENIIRLERICCAYVIRLMRLPVESPIAGSPPEATIAWAPNHEISIIQP